VRLLIAIILSLSLFLQCVSHLAVVVIFKLNQNFIARNLCINRAQPQKHCNGKCFLKKQMKRLDQSDNSKSESPTVKIEKTEVLCILPKFINISYTVFRAEKESYLPFDAWPLLPAHIPSVFHPPA
jgi:hypothetical protein